MLISIGNLPTSNMYFDGKTFAKGLEEQLQRKIAHMPYRPTLVSILDPNNAGAVTYTNLKQKMAERLGVNFVRIEDGAIDMQRLNQDPSITGIMVQLPYPGSEELIALIHPKKDVDGLKVNSPYLPAAVRAVMKIIPSDSGRIVVVGSKGVVGSRLMEELTAIGMDKDDFDPVVLQSAKVIISATGKAGLITRDMVSEGVVAIDLGFPKGDFDPAVASKASFFTPVPGGVGPVTVVSLFENLLMHM